MPINSKSKGNRFELKVAKAVRAALRLSAKECYRAPASGGHLALSSAMPGDIQFHPAIAEKLKLSIECKHVAEARLSQLFKDSSKDFWGKCLAQAERDAAKVPGWQPILIARVEREDYVVTRNEFYATSKNAYARFKRNGTLYRLTTLECFLEWLEFDARSNLVQAGLQPPLLRHSPSFGPLQP